MAMTSWRIGAEAFTATGVPLLGAKCASKYGTRRRGTPRTSPVVLTWPITAAYPAPPGILATDLHTVAESSRERRNAMRVVWG
jgi:hypothetical protein